MVPPQVPPGEGRRGVPACSITSDLLFPPRAECHRDELSSAPVLL